MATYNSLKTNGILGVENGLRVTPLIGPPALPTPVFLYSPFLSGLTPELPFPVLGRAVSLGEEFARCPAVRGAAKCESVVKPQMQKYRSPWCVSTINPKMLYFPLISGIRSLNTAICLWKAGKSPD
jgi:hypothetical protein